MRKDLKTALFSLIILLLLSNITLAAENLNASIIFQDPYNPSITRFTRFMAVVPTNISSKLYKHSIKMYINGVERGMYLQVDTSSNGETILTYDPLKELPAGQVTVLFKAFGVDNKEYSQRFTFVVNPAADKQLARYYNTARVSPRNVSAHLSLAKIYEKKFMFKDAIYEYRMALNYSPKNKEALDGWKRVFTVLDKKSITIKQITLEADIDEGVDKLGNLVLFSVKIINNSHEIIKFDPEDTLLIVDNDYQLRPISNITDYPAYARKREIINLDQYVRMKYYLGTKKFDLLGKIDIQPSVAVGGYLAYELKYPMFKFLNLWIRMKTDPKVKITFRLPFKKP